MAKENEQDFRVDFIEAIARTDNLRTLRNISANMQSIPYYFNLNNADINDILDKGIKTIRKLLGTSANSFLPLEKIKCSSPQSYFERIAKGYKEIEIKERNLKDLDKKVYDLEEKIQKSKQKGKLDKCKEYELKLACIKYPTETIEKIDTIMEDYDIRLKNAEIDISEYMDIKKSYDKLRKVANNTIKIQNGTKDTSNIAFLNKIQEDIRYFICYLFFEREGKVSESPNRFLNTYDGETKIDFEHMLLLYNYLKSIKYKDIKEVEGVLYYYALEQFYRDISPFLIKRDFVGLILKDSPTEFTSDKYEGYNRKYIPMFLVPKGYRGYIFEPKNLAQQSFIAAINKENLKIDTMVSKYKNAQDYMKTKNSGILYSFLDKDLENRLMPTLLTEDFPLNEADGEFKDALLREFQERRNIFGKSGSVNVMTDMYKRVVKPYMLEVLGSYVRVFCSQLNNLKDKEMAYIYYVSPQRIAIAVREDVSDEDMRNIFDEVFLKNLELITQPDLKDIVEGKCL